MALTESIRACFKKYTDFSGRASRSEYWWFVLFCAVSWAITNAVGAILGIVQIIGIGQIYLLALLPPSLAVTARRLHDTGRSGRWIVLPLLSIPATMVGLILFIVDLARNWDSVGTLTPLWILCFGIAVVSLVLGAVLLLVLSALPGTVGPNRYGPDPLHPELETGRF